MLWLYLYGYIILSLKNHRFYSLNSTRNIFVCWFAWIVHCFETSKCLYCFCLPAFS